VGALGLKNRYVLLRFVLKHGPSRATVVELVRPQWRARTVRAPMQRARYRPVVFELRRQATGPESSQNCMILA
jgi:hypothetical protein